MPDPIPTTYDNETEIPWHSALKPAREAWWKAAGADGNWWVEMRPGSTEYGGVDLVGRRIITKLGSPPDASQLLAQVRAFNAQYKKWPLVVCYHSGGMTMPTPVVFSTGDDPAPSPGKKRNWFGRG